MRSIDHMIGEMSVPQLLRYYGFRERQCPLDATHELTIASETYAVCHTCRIEWDIVGLDMYLAENDLFRGIPDAEEDLGSKEDVVPVVAIPSNTGSAPRIESTVTITDDFVSWVKTNRRHVYGLPEYDGDTSAAVAFVTSKKNLCLLPCVTERLTFLQLRTLEEMWLNHNLIRLPQDKKGVKRSERFPQDIRKFHGYSATMRLYTFHRRESSQMIEQGEQNSLARPTQLYFQHERRQCFGGCVLGN